MEAAVLPILRGPGPECHFEATSSAYIFFPISLKYSGNRKISKFWSCFVNGKILAIWKGYVMRDIHMEESTK